MIDIDGARLGAEAARRLRQADCCTVEPGLSDTEFERIEAQYGIQFSDDHRAFLAAGLPVCSPPEEGATWYKPWPDWRNGNPDELRSHLAWPPEGVLRAVERGYWYTPWGTRPTAPEDARAAAENHLAAVPRLVPLYAHGFFQQVVEPTGTPSSRSGARTSSTTAKTLPSTSAPNSKKGTSTPRPGTRDRTSPSGRTLFSSSAA